MRHDLVVLILVGAGWLVGYGCGESRGWQQGYEAGQQMLARMVKKYGSKETNNG